MRKQEPLFSRIARVVTTHPRIVLAIWVMLALAAVPFARLAPSSMTAGLGDLTASEAARTRQIIASHFGKPPGDNAIIVTRSSRAPRDATFRTAYDQLASEVADLPGVRAVTRYDSSSPIKLSGVVDGSYVTATIVETETTSTDAFLRALAGKLKTTHIPDSELLVTGSASIEHDFVEIAEKDARQSEIVALPLVAVVLVAAFGALVAAGIPIMVGLISVSTSLALVYALTHFMEVSVFTQSVITILGLGAGIDYALLMVNRYREELAAGRDARSAAAETGRTAGRAVAFSGLTVVVALAGLLVPDQSLMRSIGIGGMLVIFIAVLSSVTAVPATLVLLGDRINAPRGLRLRLASRSGESGFWRAWANRVMARPTLFTLLVSAFLILLALPVAQLQLGNLGAAGLSPEIASRRALDLIRPLELGGSFDTFEVVVDLGESGYDAAARSNFRDFDAALTSMPDVHLVLSPFITSRASEASGGGLGDLVEIMERSVSKDRRYLRVSVIPSAPVKSAEIAGWKSRLREAASEAGFRKVFLGGAPIESSEHSAAIMGAVPLAVGLVFLATFVLLGLAFQSLVIPLVSILMNTLTVAAAFGVITSVFQGGVGASLIGVDASAGAIEVRLPLLLFSVIFGLSLDYQVFLLARVQEGREKGLSTPAAIAEAVNRTAGVITSAALIMIVVFLSFLLGHLAAMKAVGLGLAVAVALDATLVRLVLVPAVLKLAGEYSWWMPKRLRRLAVSLGLGH